MRKLQEHYIPKKIRQTEWFTWLEWRNPSRNSEKYDRSSELDVDDMHVGSNMELVCLRIILFYEKPRKAFSYTSTSSLIAITMFSAPGRALAWYADVPVHANGHNF